MKSVAILQSNYIPWKGYFDIINSVDEFIFYDDLQYTKNDWRNRNFIKTDKGLKWLTVPCGSNINRMICEVCLRDDQWQRKHWEQITIYYKRAKFWNTYKSFFEDIYLGKKWVYLSDLNQTLIKGISHELLGIKTLFKDSRTFNLIEKKGDRVLELVKKSNGTIYYSGPAGKNYLDERNFLFEGISIEWMNYSDYPEYEQLYPPFEHNVSIIDLIFNLGPNVKDYMKSFCQ